MKNYKFSNVEITNLKISKFGLWKVLEPPPIEVVLEVSRRLVFGQKPANFDNWAKYNFKLHISTQGIRGVKTSIL